MPRGRSPLRKRQPDWLISLWLTVALVSLRLFISLEVTLNKNSIKAEAFTNMMYRLLIGTYCIDSTTLYQISPFKTPTYIEYPIHWSNFDQSPLISSEKKRGILEARAVYFSSYITVPRVSLSRAQMTTACEKLRDIYQSSLVTVDDIQ